MRASTVAILAGGVAVVLSPVLQIALDPVSYEAGAAAYLLLLPLLSVCLIAGFRLKRTETGIQFGGAKHYVVAIIYPLIVMGCVALYAHAMGATNSLETLFLRSVSSEIAIMALASIVGALVTEEVFF